MRAANTTAHSDVTGRPAWSSWSACFASRSAAAFRTSATSRPEHEAVTHKDRKKSLAGGGGGSGPPPPSPPPPPPPPAGRAHRKTRRPRGPRPPPAPPPPPHTP